ncbi:MAG: hypothetical protein HYV96_08850 [Opitutae bacterium]|nr:hypothetical protein [Opitutae bacterium]
MDRTLKLSGRPFIALTIIASPALLAAGYGVSRNLLDHHWSEAAEIAAIGGIFCAFAISQLWFTEIHVTDEKIALHGWFGEKQSVLFRDITFSKVNMMFEKDWPLSIEVFGRDQRRPVLIIRTKLLKRADIAWLVSLAALKVRH